jgi:hypothetical protein
MNEIGTIVQPLFMIDVIGDKLGAAINGCDLVAAAKSHLQ